LPFGQEGNPGNGQVTIQFPSSVSELAFVSREVVEAKPRKSRMAVRRDGIRLSVAALPNRFRCCPIILNFEFRMGRLK
jgi:hypothetical protein